MAQKTLLTLLFLLPATSLFLSAQEIRIQKLPVGSPWSNEMAPVVLDSTLYFISNRKSEWLVNLTDQNNQNLYKVYEAPLDNNGLPRQPRLFEALSREQLTAGPLSFSTDGQLLIATLNTHRNLKEVRQENEPINLGLFESYLRNNAWLPLKAINLQTGSASIGHPCLSPDGARLFFAANLSEGQGGKDLWVSTRTSTGWGPPQNLGPNINTPGDEVFPQMISGGRLYFSSNGHPGLGGMDLYYSEETKGIWSSPVALPTPINTEHDDFSSFVLSGETSGYFASNREGSDKLYHFTYEISFCEDALEVVEDQYCFTFFEDSAFDSDTVPHRYKWAFSDGGSASGAEADHCFPGPGFYEILLSVQDSISGEELYEVASYELLLEEARQVYIKCPETAGLKDEIFMQAELRGFGDVKEVQYFWDLGPGTEKQKGSTIRHSFSRKGSHTVRCEAYWEDQSWCSYRIIVVE